MSNFEEYGVFNNVNSPTHPHLLIKVSAVAKNIDFTEAKARGLYA